MTDDPYRILGVNRTATSAQIRRAYRRQAKRAHPDGGGDAREFTILKRAVDMLVDPMARSRFDSTGEWTRAERQKTPEEQFTAEVYSGLCALFMQVIESCPDPNTFDVVAACATLIRGTIANQEHAVGIAEKRLRRLRGAMGRIKPLKKVGDVAPLLAILEAQAVAFEGQLESTKNRLRVLARMAEVVGEFWYAIDFPMVSIGHGSMVFNTTNTNSNTGG